MQAHSIDIQNPFWDASLSKLVKTVAFKLGIHPDELSAKLDMLLYMEKGSSVDWCSNVEEDEDIIGSMLIQLPSIFKGGKISVFDGDEDVDEENEEDFITSFNMGGPNREAEFACHFVCHYSDCQYEIEEITSGSRLLLRYSLLYNGNDGVIPTVDLLHESVIPLKTSLTHLPRADRMILVPLRQDYSPTSLTLSGIDALSPDHRAKAESIRLAGGDSWTVLIMNAVNTYTTTRSESDVGGQSKFEVAAVYDEDGKKASFTWMKKILNFKPLEGEIDQKEERMLLSTSARLADNWGKRKSRKTMSIPNYDSDSLYGYGGYGYNDHISYEHISTYKATFLLAYDRDSVFDIKCVEASKGYISGKIVRNDGVIAAAEEVVKKQDYSMLGRLLEVVEYKEELRFERRTCQNLLEMVVNSTCDDTSLASRILDSLSTSAEPDSLLWNTIVSAVRKFNWSDLRTNISSLLCDESRKKVDSRTSRISLTVFLNRIDFCIKLTATKANDASNFALKCISHGIDDLAGSDCKGLSFGLENFTELMKLDSMVEEHGWKAMKEVVKHSLEFYSSNAPDHRIEYFTGMGRLVSKFHGNHSCNITLDAMTAFASTFSSKMQQFPDSNLKISLASSSLAESLMISIRIVIEHGEQNDMDSVGKRMISRRNIFSSFLKRASEVANDSIVPQTFLLDLLNKLFMQQSIEIDKEMPCTCPRGRGARQSSCECRWNVVSPDNATEDNTTISPSLHVKLILGANPKLAHMTDKDGRFPLHYAAARGVYETVASVLEANPKAAIVRDPLTGLYPFMLAGSNGNTAAAFELLLSDPNLVLGGIPADENNEENDRKRKRSPSM